MIFEGLWSSIWSESNFNEDCIIKKEDTAEKKKDVIESPVVEEQDIIIPQDLPIKYSEDIRALVDKFGALSKGMKIETDLKTMLQICPRHRKRVDAY